MNVFFPLIIALLAMVILIDLCFALLPSEPARSTKRGVIRRVPARSESNVALPEPEEQHSTEHTRLPT
jgi:predicted lysophospholipase L1 biosynthesis ABC-type transport system permease subunit